MPTPSLFQHVQLREPINADTALPISPEELEFFAEQEPVTIVPNFTFDRTTGPNLECIGGTYGPFQPNTPVDVPLWLALTLYQRKKCRILPPDWMRADDLRNEHGPILDDNGELRQPGLSTVLERERTELQFFQPLPEYYIEIAHILLRDAIEIFAPDTHKVKNLLSTLRAARYAKIESGLKKVSGAITVKLNNLSATECNMIRLLFKGTMNMYLQLGKRDKVWSTAAANDPLSL